MYLADVIFKVPTATLQLTTTVASGICSLTTPQLD